MLIQTSKSLNYGQRKPRQWGPISAVRYAVRENAERLGIDSSLIKIVVPFWEKSGIVINNAVTTDNLSTTSPLWATNGYRCSITNKWDTGKTLAAILGSTSSKYTVISSGGVVARPTASNFFFGDFQDGGTGYDLGMYQSSSTNTINWYYKSGANVAISGGVVTNGAEIMCGATWDGVTVAGYFAGQLSATAAHTAAMGATQTFKGGGQWATGNGTFDHRLLIIIADALTADQMAEIYTIPYALLMPVSRPTYSFPSSEAITLTIANCIAASSLSTTTLVEKASLIVQHLTGLSAITNISLQAGVQLLVDSLSASSAVEQAALVQKATLAIANAASTSTLSNTALLQASILAVASAGASSQLSNIQLSEAALLAVNSLISATLADNINFTTATLLSVQSISSATALQLASLLQKATLQLASLSALAVVSSSDLAQRSTITPTSLTAASNLTTIDLASGLLLSLSNLTSYGSLTTAEIVQKSTLAIEALQSISSVQTTSLAEAAQLAINSLVSAGLLSPTALEIAFLLTVDNLGAASIIQNVSLGDVKFQLQLANLLSSGQLSSVNLILPSDGYCLVFTASSKDFAFTTLPINFTLS